MTDQNIREQLAEIKQDLSEIRRHVTDLRIEQKGLQIKSSLFGAIGGVLSTIPIVIALLFKR